eukprot:TRINITY_DN47980_c0_g1_i1.p1 TRINITY_DN47980_c0_g1~~TRINITY_DN47980_c0_g1_i1.p1  ORF type:complete len:169 (+),score=62.80 TRINITY_DN47980_c0_g1_i1:76-507(+)
MSRGTRPGTVSSEADWELLVEEKVEKERRRVELSSAVARERERQLLTCLHRVKATGSPIRSAAGGVQCQRELSEYIDWVSRAYCPLPLYRWKRCQLIQGEDCPAEHDALLQCLGCYGQLGQLTTVQAMGFPLQSASAAGAGEL